MRIVFMGTPDFSVPCLDKLVNEGYEVAAVVTQPDRPKGRKRTLTPPPVKAAAEKHGIPVLQPEKIKEKEAIDDVLQHEPELIVTAAYGQIVPKEILDAPRFGCINVHASLLPKYRGGAPIHHAVINGERETGVTIMYMVPKLDAGDMLQSVRVPIAKTDTVGTLHDKLSEAGSELLLDTIPKLKAGTITPVPQNEAEATFAYNITREDERIRWDAPSQAVYNRVRGLNPWPVAYTTWNGGQRLKLWWVEIREEGASPSQKPGTVLAVREDGIDLATADGAVTLKELQPAGKQRMDVASFVRGIGQQLQVGDRLGDEQ